MSHDSATRDPGIDENDEGRDPRPDPDSAEYTSEDEPTEHPEAVHDAPESAEADPTDGATRDATDGPTRDATDDVTDDAATDAATDPAPSDVDGEEALDEVAADGGTADDPVSGTADTTDVEERTEPTPEEAAALDAEPVEAERDADDANADGVNNVVGVAPVPDVVPVPELEATRYAETQPPAAQTYTGHSYTGPSGETAAESDAAESTAAESESAESDAAGPETTGPETTGPTAAGPDVAPTDTATDTAATDAATADATGDGGELMPGDVPAEPLATLWAGSAAQDFRDRWRDVQLRFVDDPRAAAGEAKALVGEVADALAAAVAEQRSALDGWESANGGDTEELRVVVRRYRDFMDRVLRM